MYLSQPFFLSCKIDDEDRWYKISLDTIVGETIDSLENIKYDLFSIKRGFRKAEIFYHREASLIEVIIRHTDKFSKIKDSMFFISYYDLISLVEKVYFYDSIKSGNYKIGTSRPHIDILNQNLFLLVSDYTMNKIPFSINSARFKREKFNTIKFIISYGKSYKNVSQLDNIIDFGANIEDYYGFYLHFPILDRPDIFLRIGLNSEWDGRLPTYHAAIFHKFSFARSFLSPIVGLGLGYTSFSQDEYYSHIVSIRKTYPIVCFGVNIFDDWIDIIGIIPIDTQQSTQYKDKNYVIDLVGFEIKIHFIL